MEAVGIEPTSGTLEVKTSTCLACVLNSLKNSHRQDFLRVTSCKNFALVARRKLKGYPANRRVSTLAGVR